MEQAKTYEIDKSNNFDTVETFRIIKEKIAEETFHLSNDEYLAYLEKNSLVFRNEQSFFQSH